MKKSEVLLAIGKLKKEYQRLNEAILCSNCKDKSLLYK